MTSSSCGSRFNVYPSARVLLCIRVQICPGTPSWSGLCVADRAEFNRDIIGCLTPRSAVWRNSMPGKGDNSHP